MSNIVRPDNLDWRFQMSDDGGIEDVMAPGGRRANLVRYDADDALGNFGLRTILFGDSMTDWYHQAQTPSAASYNASTRELTITASAAHYAWVGASLVYWNYDYPGLRNQQRLTVSQVDSATVLRAILSRAPENVPGGSLSGAGQYRLENARSIANPINMLQMRMGWPLAIVRNAAQSGEWSKGGLARLQADVLDYAPQLVIMQSLGINDQTYAYQDAETTFLSEEKTIAFNRQIYDAILAAGAYLIVGTITPVASAETARAKKDIMDRVTRINADLWRYAQGKVRMFVYDGYASIIDPTNTTGLATSTLLRSDGIHWGVKGAIRVAKLIEPFITNLLATVTSTLPKSAIQSHNSGALTVSSATGSGTTVTVTLSAAHNWRSGEQIRVTGMGDSAANGVFTIDSVTSTTITYTAPGLATTGAISGTKIISRSRNIFRNNLLLTATGGTLATITGTAAQYMRCDVGNTTAGYTGSASVAADDSGFGNKQVVAVTAVNADGTPRTQITAAGTSSYAVEMAGNGRYYRFECVYRLKSTSWSDTPISDVRAYIEIVGSDGNTYRGEAVMGWDGSEAGTIVENQDWHIRTPAVYIPIGVTVSSSVFMVWARHSGAISGGATFTAEMARVAVMDVTDFYGEDT